MCHHHETFPNAFMPGQLDSACACSGVRHSRLPLLPTFALSVPQVLLLPEVRCHCSLNCHHKRVQSTLNLMHAKLLDDACCVIWLQEKMMTSSCKLSRSRLHSISRCMRPVRYTLLLLGVAFDTTARQMTQPWPAECPSPTKWRPSGHQKVCSRDGGH